MLVPAPAKYVDPFSYVKAFTPAVWLGIFLAWLGMAAATACLNVARSEILVDPHQNPQPSKNLLSKLIDEFGLYTFRYFQYMFQCKCHRLVFGGQI